MGQSEVKNKFLQRRSSLQNTYSDARIQEKIDGDLLLGIPEEAKNEGLNKPETFEVVDAIVADNPSLIEPYKKVKLKIWAKINLLFSGLDIFLFK